MEWIYQAAMKRRRATALARRESEIAPCPVISIGNLTTGGTGKTPAVQWLARALQNQGWTVGIAARGYGGALSERGALVSKGKLPLLNARDAGDEALVHARNLRGAVVAVAKDRHRAVEMCAHNGAQIVILDDGFQFWSLPRAFDLVLLDAKNPFGNGHLLPWGRLREEKAALKRASAILLTRCDRATSEEIDRARLEIGKWTFAPIFLSRHATQDLRNETSGEIVSLGALRDHDVKAFSGLADNAQFYESLKILRATRIYRLKRERGDHHVWSSKDFDWFEDAPSINAHQRENLAGKPVITTEKDAAKLDLSWFDCPVFSLRIALEPENPAALLALIYKAVGEPNL